MGRRRLLLLLKPLDVYSLHQSTGVRHTNPKVLQYIDSRCKVHKDAIEFCQDILKRKSIEWDAVFRSHLSQPIHNVLQYIDSRCKVHKDAIEFCQDILKRKSIEWDAVFRSHLSQPIHNVDLVVTIGGDGTLLRASHFLNDKIPLLGLNSDPTQPQEVEELGDEFDATRSTGFLCAATVKNFEQMLNNILENGMAPTELSRMAIRVNSEILPLYALNDVLISDPCPAAVSRFSFRIRKDGRTNAALVNCRSSGLRVSTAAGSTAAMLSAGGYSMPVSSKDLQYMVREPISTTPENITLMHGVIKQKESMDINWETKEGIIYIDGAHIVHPVQHGDTIQISSNAPNLKIFLPHHLLESKM